jgi:hypothetical protein
VIAWILKGIIAIGETSAWVARFAKANKLTLTGVVAVDGRHA